MNPDLLTDGFMVFLRTSGMLAVFPLFSPSSLPIPLRVALSALVAVLVAPTLPAPVVPPDTLPGLVGVMIMEVGVGMLLGYISRLIFVGLEMAGGIIGTEMGLTLSTNFNPMSGTQDTTAGAILHYLALVLWLSLDLHHWLLAALQKTYLLLPVGGAHLREALLLEVLERTGHFFVVALQIAAPVMAVSFMISLLFSVLGRAVPQMNVFGESFALRIIAGLAVFGMTCQLTAQHIVNYLDRLPEDVLRVAQLLAA